MYSVRFYLLKNWGDKIPNSVEGKNGTRTMAIFCADVRHPKQPKMMGDDHDAQLVNGLHLPIVLCCIPSCRTVVAGYLPRSNPLSHFVTTAMRTTFTCRHQQTWGNLVRSVVMVATVSFLLENDGATGFQFPRTGFLQNLPLPRIEQSTASSQVLNAFTSTTKIDDEARQSINLVVDADGRGDDVPTTMRDAIRTFLFVGDYGPLYVISSILAFASWRLQLSSLDAVDGMVFGATVLFWSFQEHFLHEKVLHSQMDWMGKEIHQGHHDKPFYHISIDPAPLLLGWMLTMHVALRTLLPLPMALTATVAYSLSGLFYEWAHYIVHTKVRFRSSFWKRVKENHLRHHVVSDEYWFAFSLPVMDDIFHTNPSVRQVRKYQLEEEKRRNRATVER